jgi:hypothetical protein
LGGFKALSDAGDGFGKNFFAGRASKAALQYFEFYAAAADGLVFDLYPSTVMHRGGFNGTLWAHLEVGFFGAFVPSSELIALPVGNDFQFWQKYEIGRRFPVGIHSTFLLKIEAS